MDTFVFYEQVVNQKDQHDKDQPKQDWQQQHTYKTAAARLLKRTLYVRGRIGMLNLPVIIRRHSSGVDVSLWCVRLIHFVIPL